MSKKTRVEEVQQLIDLGKEKGFLTYDEVNDALPADMVSSSQLDDVMSMFGDMDIEVLSGIELGEEVVVGPFQALRKLKEWDRIAIDERRQAAADRVRRP